MNNNDGRMRLAYNFTTGDCAVYPSWAEGIVLFGDSPTGDDNFPTTGDKMINENDAYSVYDVNHWTSEDMSDFVNMSPGDQLGVMENLDELFDED